MLLRLRLRIPGVPQSSFEAFKAEDHLCTGSSLHELQGVEISDHEAMQCQFCHLEGGEAGHDVNIPKP